MNKFINIWKKYSNSI